VDHAGQLPRSFPWRAATIVVGAIAAIELVVLIGIGATQLAASLRPHAQAAPAKAAAGAREHVVPRVVAPPAQRLRPRARLSVIILNGNGVNGAAGAQAARLETLGYGPARAADAPRHDYARSMVLFVPGYAREARRLGRDAGVRIVAPIDGVSRAQLKGSQLVVVLGGS